MTGTAATGAQTATAQGGTAVVAGQVIDATTGRPVGGAVVTLALGAPADASATGQQPLAPAQSRRGVAVANSDGRFVFRDVPAGTFSITATRPGFAAGASGRRRPGGPGRPFTIGNGARLTNTTISIWPLAAIGGTVRDDRGDAAVGVAVWALRRAVVNGRLALTFAGSVESTDERGRYRLANLMPGSYAVQIRTHTQTAAVSTVDAWRAAVTSGTTGPMMGQMSQTGGLRLTTAGLVVDDWQVSVSSGMTQPIPGPDGSLLIHPTLYHPSTTDPGAAAILTLEAGDERLGIDLTLPLVAGMRISGVLEGPEGPAPGHGLRLYPLGPDRLDVDQAAAYGTTDRAGRFALLGVPPGRYLLRAYRVPMRTPVARPVPSAAGALPGTTVEVLPPSAGPSLYAELPVAVGTSHVDDLVVQLQAGARLSGHLVFDGTTARPPAERLQQVSLTVYPMAGSSPANDARVDTEGRFTTAGYAPGRYTLFTGRAPGPEWTLASVRVAGVDVAGRTFTIGTSDINDVVVTFTDTVMTLSGTVRAADGGTETDATIVAFPADAREWIEAGMPRGRLATASTSSNGTYQIRLPLPGDYHVVAVPLDASPEVDPDFVARFAPQAVRVSFARGETKTQPLTIGRAR
ncbi:MAG TPA: carboxypeptidase-like regulatory domain-containing protein [Vicinamibacterales bacterium]|nr:carboxypeptidase-like regulatory domain-containing protein [Vicinamibacterales bacterium]